MATGKALNGKPYAGNPHVRFDEGEVASAATSRRGSLLYSTRTGCAALAVATVTISAFAAFAGGKNLVVNGTFDSGELTPWTRNTTKGRANKQGNVAVYQAGGKSTWVNAALSSVCGSHAVAIQSYNLSDSKYYNSTDTYISAAPLPATRPTKSCKFC